MRDKNEKRSIIENILESVDVGILAVDNNLIVKVFNKQAEKIIGRNKDAVISKHIKFLYPNDPYEYQFIQRTIIEEKEFKNAEEIVKVNGKKIELLVDTNLLKNEYGETIGAVCLFKDITNFKKLEKGLEENERLKLLSELSAGVAHEIRNPLAGIKGFLQLLEINYKKESVKEKNLFHIHSVLEEVDRIDNITKEFLLLSKDLKVIKSEVNINKLIKNVLSLMETLSLQKSIRIETRLDYNFTSIYGHGEHLKQVFINLIKNSIEALEIGGKILIQSYFQDKQIKVEVVDNGSGIPSKIIDKIVYPFFTTKAEGTGLGLSICKRIIQNHGGKMDIESREGKGTTIRVFLPIN